MPWAGGPRRRWSPVGSVWVTNFLDNSVSRLGMDGILIDTIPVERGPHDLLSVGDMI